MSVLSICLIVAGTRSFYDRLGVGILFGFQFGSSPFESDLEHQLLKGVSQFSSADKWILRHKQVHLCPQKQMKLVPSPEIKYGTNTKTLKIKIIRFKRRKLTARSWNKHRRQSSVSALQWPWVTYFTKNIINIGHLLCPSTRGHQCVDPRDTKTCRRSGRTALDGQSSGQFNFTFGETWGCRYRSGRGGEPQPFRQPLSQIRYQTD